MKTTESRDDGDGTRRSLHRRAFTAFVALAIGASGMAFFLVAYQLSGGGSSSEPAAGDAIAVLCHDGEVEVSSPQVQVQSDGLHITLDADFDEPILTIFYGGGGRAAHGLGAGVGRSDSFVLPIPPGDVSLGCGKEESDDPSKEDAQLNLIDPAGFWHEQRLSCGQEILELADHPFYYTQDNPFPRALVATLPGLQVDDVIDYAGYPASQFGTSYRVVRNGEVLGRFDLSTYDRRTFVMHGVFCRSSGIGDAGSSVVGMTSTPFGMPGYAACDPYAGTCSSIFVSARWHDEYAGGSLEPVAPAPWSSCSDETSDGCIPASKDMVVRIVTSEEDARRFEAEFDCGGTEQTACI